MGYHGRMRRVAVLSAAILALLAAAGCDTGGLLIITSADAGTDAGPTVALGPNASDFVNGGTVASNEKYKVVYSLGQATPNQAPISGPSGTLNGGLIGATEGK